jgi:hypothetical protein
MKIVFSPLVNAVLLIIIAITGVHCNAKSQGDEKGFAVVELFTSEGCSSCPAAEAVVAKLVSKKEEEVYVLSYHVDYWNKLGWIDSFSKAEYTQRQSMYAARFNINSIYTPQIVVNGSSEFVGSDGTKLKKAVAQKGQETLISDLSITTTQTANGISINYSITGKEEVLLNIALVQPEATTKVKRGENGGRTLHHVNVVRLLHTLTVKGNGTASIELPKELAYIPLNIIAFTQDKKTLKVFDAERKFL